MQFLTESYWGKEVTLTYGEIPQRWLVVFSQAAYDQELHTLTKNQEKERQAAEKVVAQIECADVQLPGRCLKLLQNVQSVLEVSPSSR